MIRYCFNPLGKRFDVPIDMGDNPAPVIDKSRVVEFLTLAHALGENLDIVPVSTVVEYGTVPTLVPQTITSFMVTVDLDYRLETDDFLYIVRDDSSVTRNVEALDKPYATSGRLYGLLTEEVNNSSYKRDSDDFIKLNFSTYTREGKEVGEELLIIVKRKDFMFITSNVNSTLTESYQPLSSYDMQKTSIRYYDLEDLAVDAMNMTTDNALVKNIEKKPILQAKLADVSNKIQSSSLLTNASAKVSAVAPRTLTASLNRF